MTATRLGLAAIALFAAACASAPAVPQGRDRDRAPERLPPRSDQERGKWGDRLLLTATAIPAAWLTRDLDGVASNGDATTSSGFALRAATGNTDQSIGVLWQSLYGDDDAIDAQAVGLDVDVRTPITDDTGRFWLRAGATLGGAWLDLPGGSSRTFAADAQLRFGLDFQPTHFFWVSPTIGGVVFGHPGETEAYGAIFGLDIGLVF